MSEEIKRIDLSEFVQFGYLQELNRQFLHPLGLALEVIVEDGEVTRFGGVWDYRNDPEGIVFADGAIDGQKMSRVEMEWHEKYKNRSELLGFMVQPV